MKSILVILFSLFAFSFIQAQIPDHVPTNGLVGWFPFNRNANDASGNGNNGIVTGATLTSDRFNIPNAAYSFNGISDMILVKGLTDSLRFDYLIDDYSVVLWVKSADPNIGGTSCRII